MASFVRCKNWGPCRWHSLLSVNLTVEELECILRLFDRISRDVFLQFTDTSTSFSCYCVCAYAHTFPQTNRNCVDAYSVSNSVLLYTLESESNSPEYLYFLMSYFLIYLIFLLLFYLKLNISECTIFNLLLIKKML